MASLGRAVPNIRAGKIGIPERPCAALERAHRINGAGSFGVRDGLIPFRPFGAFFLEKNTIVFALCIAMFKQAHTAEYGTAVFRGHFLR